MGNERNGIIFIFFCFLRKRMKKMNGWTCKYKKKTGVDLQKHKIKVMNLLNSLNDSHMFNNCNKCLQLFDPVSIPSKRQQLSRHSFNVCFFLYTYSGKVGKIFLPFHSFTYHTYYTCERFIKFLDIVYTFILQSFKFHANLFAVVFLGNDAQHGFLSFF